MFRKKFKKMICTLLAATCILGASVVAYADTTDFTLTVTRSGSNEDNMSKRTNKAGGASHENKFYVTPTSFSGTTGTLYVKSIQLYNTAVYSQEIDLRSVSTLNVTRNAAYNTYAASGEYYYLKGRFGASTGDTLKVLGRYTP